MTTNISRLCALLVFTLLSLPISAKTLLVSAAASLSNAFKEMGQEYQRQYPGVTVRLNSAGSGVLLQQLLQGAPVDVLAVADQQTMDMAAAKNAINTHSRRTFVRNDLVLIVPINSRLQLQKLSDLQQPAIKRIALSQPHSVPVGRYTKTALIQAGLFERLQSKIITTQNVRQSLDYVARQEVDAGFVYRTDAALMPNKVRISSTIALTNPVSYPIAISRTSRQAAEAQRFIDFILSAKGQSILQKYGFSQP